MVKSSLFAILFALFFAHFIPAEAQAAPVVQDAERVIFAVDRQNSTITMVVSITFTGRRLHSYWLIPVPAQPISVAFTSADWINDLQGGTDLYFNDPAIPCDMQMPNGYADGIPLNIPEQAPTKVDDYKVFSGDDAFTQLEDWGYPLNQIDSSALQQYIDAGMYFVALKVTDQPSPTPENSDSSDTPDVKGFPPVVITYKGNQPTLPIQLAKLTAKPDMPVMVWIASDGQFAPKNFDHPKVDYHPIQGALNLVGSIGRSYTSPYPTFPEISYEGLRRKAIQADSGRAFITEYAGTSDVYMDVGENYDFYSQQIRIYPYLTRLYSEISPEATTPDPTFWISDSLPDFTGRVELGDWVDPLYYYGCSDRLLLDDQTKANLPSGRLFIPEMQTEIAYPADWKVMHYAPGIWIAAPTVVDSDYVKEALNGDNPAPLMLLMTIAESQADPAQLPYDLADMIHARLNVDLSTAMLAFSKARYSPFTQTAFMSDPQQMVGLFQGIVAAVVTSDDDWAQNQAMYEAMVNYATDYQFFTSPTLRHTLFLGDEIHAAQIPYPDGWIEYSTAHAVNDFWITPQGTLDTKSVPSLHIQSRDTVSGQDELADILKAYGLPPDTPLSAVERTPLPFSANGRKGFIRLLNSLFPSYIVYIVEVSAPEAQYDQYSDVLQTIANSILEGQTVIDQRG